MHGLFLTDEGNSTVQTDGADRRQRQQVFVYVAGSRWGNVQGTDHRLAAALARRVHVLWVDPPLPIHQAFRHQMNALRGPLELSEVAHGITRLRSLGIPGFTRRALAAIASGVLGYAIRNALRAIGATPIAVMVSSPTAGFPARTKGRKILFVTDDWVAGAPMMGLSGPLVSRTLRRNLREANIVAAVSPYLAESLGRGFADCPASVVVLPNGCDPRKKIPLHIQRADTAALVGQLNERLDMDLLEAVAEAGVPVLVIGPRTERDAETRRRLDLFLKSENVTWLGELPATELGQHLEAAGVGLTPYADTTFNRASFPLKTLDYLAAGVPVIATDLPAVRWLDTDLVTIASGREEFAKRVQQALAAPHDSRAEEERRHFAGLHTWEARANQLLKVAEVHIQAGGITA